MAYGGRKKVRSNRMIIPTRRGIARALIRSARSSGKRKKR